MKILSTQQKNLDFENLEFLKQKGDYPYEYRRFPDRKYFCSSTKDGKIGDNGKISSGHISVKDFKRMTCKRI